MNKITLIFPIWLVLGVINDLGKTYDGYTIGGSHIVTMIILSFGFWIIGYISGRLDEN